MRQIVMLLLVLSTAAMTAGCSAKKVNETSGAIIDDMKNFGNKVTEQH